MQFETMAEVKFETIRYSGEIKINSAVIDLFNRVN